VNNKEDIEKIRLMYNEGWAKRRLKEQFNKELVAIALQGLKLRTKSEAIKLAHKKYPESFKCSDKTREKIRKARVNYLKKKTGQTAYERRAQNKMSYGEKWLHDLFIKNKVYEKYDVINEYCEFPYFIDFAFVNEKIAVEFDGKCHFENGKRRQDHDRKKDEHLNKKGWRVFRIPYYEMRSFDIQKLFNFIGSGLKKRYDADIVKYRSIRLQKMLLKKEEAKKRKEKNKEIRKNKLNGLIEKRKNDISNIYLTEYGWVSELSELWGVTHTQVKRFMKLHMPELLNKCYVRRKTQ